MSIMGQGIDKSPLSLAGFRTLSWQAEERRAGKLRVRGEYLEFENVWVRLEEEEEEKSLTAFKDGNTPCAVREACQTYKVTSNITVSCLCYLWLGSDLTPPLSSYDGEGIGWECWWQYWERDTVTSPHWPDLVISVLVTLSLRTLSLARQAGPLSLVQIPPDTLLSLVEL